MRSIIQFGRRSVQRTNLPNYSIVSPCRLFSSSDYNPSRECKDLNEGLVGFPIARLRVTNILRACVDGKPYVRALNVYCDDILPVSFGKLSNVELFGCTASEENANVCRKLKQYSQVDVVDMMSSFPYSACSFDAVICLRPPFDTLETPFIHLDSLASTLGDGGFMVLGLTEAEVKHYDISGALDKIDSRYGVGIVGFQIIACTKEDIVRVSGRTDEIDPIFQNYYLISLHKKM